MTMDHRDDGDERAVLPSMDNASCVVRRPVCNATTVACTAAGSNSVRSREELTVAAANAPVQKPSRWLSWAVG